jgi:hypothetical protein
MPDLDLELARAVNFARKATQTIPLPISRRWVQWGLARVSFFGFDRQCYEPDPGGDVLAFIAPVVEGGELIDLAAIDARNDHVGWRCDLGHGLGLDVVEKARQRCCELRLVETAMAWLADPRDAVWLRDLSELPMALDGVEVIACANLPLADRVAVLLPPSERSRAQVA